MIKFSTIEFLLEKKTGEAICLPKEWYSYLRKRRELYEKLTPQHVEMNLVSEANYVLRSKYESGEEVGIMVHAGDICYMDYGQVYLNEMGYQHFGLVLTIFHKKALVIPMTSNPAQYETAYDPFENPGGKKHLMRIGKPKGLVRNSVLFLNDSRFVNTARIIEVKSHIDVNSELFSAIKRRYFYIIDSEETD